MTKHLTYDDRLEIERLIKLDFSLSGISTELNRHKSTISREITIRSSIDKKGCYGRNYNACIHRYNCDITNICKDEACKKKYKSCCFCGVCNDNCEYFKEDICEKLKSTPYVCNNCENRNRCTLKKSFYSAKAAQKDYEGLLVEARIGLESSPEEIMRLDNIIKPLIDQGQSVHHILANNKDSIMVCEKTIYKYIEVGALSIKNIDLPRKVRYRPRKKKLMGYKVDKRCLEDRRYEDYLNFIEENKDIAIVEMDTVEGKKGGKVLLTIHFVDSSFMLMFIRDANDSKSVTECFERIYYSVGKELFKKLFSVLLTDNGSEFSNPAKIENIDDGEKLTSIFYCHPYAAYEKPEVENNHALIRRVIPKGTSMDPFNQQDINLLMSHINSYGRKKLNDQSPFDAFSSRYGFELINSLGISKIHPNDIILKPSLLK
ncbi:MAG: IS30 family transposase [Tissierellia bacterium]|jgi:IS30 family transposase|nr:IS30 family transposase [Tissierellia bacterium]